MTKNSKTLSPYSKSWYVADDIIRHLRDRKGIGDVWDQIDDDLQDEIRESLATIINDACDDA